MSAFSAQEGHYAGSIENRIEIAHRIWDVAAAYRRRLQHVGSQQHKVQDSIGELARLMGNEALDQRVEKRVFEGRMHVWMALATGDQEHWSKSDEAFKLAVERLDELTKNTTDPGRLAQVQQWGGLISELPGRRSQVPILPWTK